ncbi:hypothetical protein CMO88_02150 [Candidatus Woesearchaeota archaeon]|nr:hypothetical protein [Candidatus Woesearchaeota archaeon]|tara:strand:- start:11038 stop:11628 length:591 start_codon:yes stop_codon:yes gene_type:complete
MSELEEIKKLDPEERIKRLKEIEEGRKREIEEAESLIRDSMREIGDAEEKKHAPIEQVKARDISQLATAEEKSIFKTARFEGDKKIEELGETVAEAEMQNLEELADSEAKEKGKIDHKPIYGQAIEDAKAKVDYSSKVTTTGADTSGEGSQQVYRTGASDGPQQMYERETGGDVSDSYVKREEEKEKKRREEQQPW